jgi:hypothetical protein
MYYKEEEWELVRRLRHTGLRAFLKDLGFMVIAGIIFAAMVGFLALEPWEKWNRGKYGESDLLILKKGTEVIVTEEDGITTIRTVDQESPDTGPEGIQ